MLFKNTLAVAAASLALSVSAQNSTTNSTTSTNATAALPYNITFLQGLAQHLATLNLTSLASAVTASINSTGTLTLLKNLNGTSKTLLAPNNEAFTGFQNLYPNASDPEYLGDRLAYHLLAGSFPGSAFASYPNHTIARTYLNDSASVQLEGGLAQAIVFSIEGGATRVLNQNTNVTITSTTSYENLLIQIVDAVVDLPGNLSTALTEWNLTDATQTLTALGLVDPISATKGFTLFVPNDAAFANASQLATLATTNASAVAAIFQNHIVNGSTIYSTELGSAHATSAGGEAFTFASNGTGTFVTSGNYTAKVVTADILLDNGVLHIIDTVLFNTANNTGAATSAYQSATSAAAAAATSAAPTGPVGNNAGSSGGSSSGSSGSSSSSKSAAGPVANILSRAQAVQAIVALVGVFAGAAVLI